jgi:hypothetical protein
VGLRARKGTQQREQTLANSLVNRRERPAGRCRCSSQGVVGGLRGFDRGYSATILDVPQGEDCSLDEWWKGRVGQRQKVLEDRGKLQACE